MGLFQEFMDRGLVAQVTDNSIGSLLDNSRISAYIGFDPTADSLHVGHLVQIFNLRRLQEHGHTPIAVAGGATGMIGDPSGKNEERNLLDEELLNFNLGKIREQLKVFLDFSGVGNKALLLNNADWLMKLSLVNFLRDTGKHFTVNQMISKDSVKTRLDQREQGISFTEFSYMLLQAYDFLHLFDTHNCMVQMGASDQWGNITAGIELIRRTRQASAFGMTTPLILKADGTKFGKSEGGTVWLDPEKTSPYQFYQYFLRVEDEVVGTYLRSFTWLDLDQIAELDVATMSSPKDRTAQKALAFHITRLVHGAEMADKVRLASEALFSESIFELSGDLLDMVVSDAPSLEIAVDSLARGVEIVDLLVSSGLTKSKSEARKIIDQGGVYVNNSRLMKDEGIVDSSRLIDGRLLLLRKGKKDYVVVRGAQR